MAPKALMICALLVSVIVELIISAARAQVLSRSELVNIDLANTQQADQYTQISNDSDSFYVIHRPSQLSLNKGLMIFLPDANSAYGSRTSIMQLANKMPQWGWTTVLLPGSELSNQVSAQVPQQSEAETQVNEQTPAATQQAADAALPVQIAYPVFDKNALEQFSQQLVSRLALVQKEYESVRGHRVIVVEGQSSVSFLSDMTKTKTTTPDAIVLSNPYQLSYESNQTIPDLIARTSPPVLDLVSTSDNRWSHATKQQRIIASRVGLKGNYRQREWHGTGAHEDEVDHMAREVYGWTSSLGW